MLGFIRLLHLDLTCLIPFGQHVQHHDQFGHQTCFRCVVIRHFSCGQAFDNEKADPQWKFTSFLVVFGFLQGPNHTYSGDGHDTGAPNGNFREYICSEDDLRSRIFGAFVVTFLACLPLLGFSNIYKMV